MNIQIGRFQFKIRPKVISDEIIGIDSLVSDSNKHILMIDYDNNLQFDTLVSEVIFLQKHFSLGDCHIILSSPKKYHVVFFDDAMDYFDCLRVIHKSSCCEYFKKQRMLRNHITIRISPKYNNSYFGKPRVVCVVVSKTKKSYDYPIKLIDELREFKRFYLSFIDFEKEVIVKNG